MIATGSEVETSQAAAKQLQKQNIPVRVVSMPCCEVFKKQDDAYRESVLPTQIMKRIAVEAAVPDYWYQFVGIEGKVIGIDQFGASAPYQDVFREFNITVECIVETIQQLFHTQKVSSY